MSNRASDRMSDGPSFRMVSEEDPPLQPQTCREVTRIDLNENIAGSRLTLSVLSRHNAEGKQSALPRAMLSHGDARQAAMVPSLPLYEIIDLNSQDDSPDSQGLEYASTAAGRTKQ